MQTKDTQFSLYHSLQQGTAIKTTPNEENPLLPARIQEVPGLDSVERPVNLTNEIYYISDIHLDEKVEAHFIAEASDGEIRRFISEIADSLISSIGQSLDPDYLLIVGDVSHNFHLYKMFFSELSKKRYKIITVLGNHELAATDLNRDLPFGDIVQIYKDFLSSLGVICLQNDLLIINRESRKATSMMSFFSDSIHVDVLNEEMLVSLKNEEIQERCSKAELLVFGSVGFLGCSDESIEKYLIPAEKKENDSTCNYIYKKLMQCLSGKRLVVATHMPLDKWTDKGYLRNWFYLWGHTHHNYYCLSDEKTVFADNQIGPTGKNLKFKMFTLDMSHNNYQFEKNGIYTITNGDYIDFYRGFRVEIGFSRKYQAVYLLKNAGCYCFLARKETGELVFLNGGRPTKIKRQDVSYYFDNLPNYSETIKSFICNFNKRQKEISKYIKSIGGEGTIHGAIIDIDYYNHIYLNPIDGSTTTYFANSMTEKYVYQNLLSLLEEKCPEIYQKCSLLNRSGDKDDLIPMAIGKEINKEPIFVENTEMYHYSRILKGLQYTTDFNIVRFWNEKIANGAKGQESNLLPQLFALQNTK